MPWPTGARTSRPGRGDPLADRRRHRRPADRRPRARDLRPARRAAGRRSCGCWRPAGGSIFIVPNRSGLWARRDVTPFGTAGPTASASSKPCSGRHRLGTERHAAALYAPPSHHKFWVQAAYFWERVGRRFDPRVVAGALLVEAVEAGLCPAAVPAPRSPCPARSMSSRASPGPSPSRCAATAAAPSPPPLDGSRRRARRPAQLHCHHQRIATLPSLCYHRADFDGDRGRFRARMRMPSRGGRVEATEGCQCPAQLH